MSTEALPKVQLAEVERSPNLSLSESFDTTVSVVQLAVNVLNWEKIPHALCTLRASNIGAIVVLELFEDEIDDSLMPSLFAMLRDWDQLSLDNFLVLCGGYLPSESQAAFEAEAKIEMRWVREWMMASFDERFYRYPSLPWKKFIRKIVSENYDFAMRFWELALSPSSEDNKRLMEDHLKLFLVMKKKAVCIFPKNWGRSH